MPSRTIEESHRPRVSDRTMHCHSTSGQSSGLLFQKRLVPSRHEMEPQGRGSGSTLRTRRRNRTRPLRKTTLGVRGSVQTVGLNAEKKIGVEPPGRFFLLTFLFIGLRRFRRFSGLCGHRHNSFRGSHGLGANAQRKKGQNLRPNGLSFGRLC
jgi:hypothetical protein